MVRHRESSKIISWLRSIYLQPNRDGTNVVKAAGDLRALNLRVISLETRHRNNYHSANQGNDFDSKLVSFSQFQP